LTNLYLLTGAQIDKVQDRKRICNFLLVISRNFGRISNRSRDIDA